MKKTIGLGLALAGALLLGGCAGYHTMPPANYSDVAHANDRVIKLVFDQEGTLYPPSDVLTPPQQMDNRNSAFTLKSSRGFGEEYNDTPFIAAAAKKIADRAVSSRNGRIVFLIKGFNNSYEEFDNEYAFLRQRIHDYEPNEDLTFVQVYWDALWKGPGTAPAPLAYWGDSMTYSNLAGMCGLRRVLRLLPRGTKASFVTHSRGAAVALGAVTNPIYQRVNHCNVTGLPDGSLADSFLVAFAPAIGDGHMRNKEGAVVNDMYRNLDRIYVGLTRRTRRLPRLTWESALAHTVAATPGSRRAMGISR